MQMIQKWIQIETIFEGARPLFGVTLVSFWDLLGVLGALCAAGGSPVSLGRPDGGPMDAFGSRLGTQLGSQMASKVEPKSTPKLDQN